MGASKGSKKSLGASGGSGLGGAIGGIVKRVAGGPMGTLAGIAGATGSALGSIAGGSSYSGSEAFTREAREAKEALTKSKKEDKEDTNASSPFDYEAVKNRLLGKAKEERLSRDKQLAQEKETYQQSLPTLGNNPAAQTLLGPTIQQTVTSSINRLPDPLQMMFRGG